MFSNSTKVLMCILVLTTSTAYAFEKEINAISKELATEIKAAGKLTVAVVDFTDLDGNVTKLGRFLAEEFSAAVVEADTGLEVINRTHLKVIMVENKLAGTGVIDPSTALRLGQITGVQVLITGTMTDMGESIRIVVTALDSNTARIIRAVRGEIPKTQAITQLLNVEVAAGSTAVKGPDRSRKKAPAGVKYGADGYSFIFDRCVRAGTRVTCHFQVTNEKEDRIFYTFAGYGNAPNITGLFDDLGNEYTATQAVLGKIQSDSFTKKTMITGIAIPASFAFEGVVAEATYVSVLQVGFEGAVRNHLHFKIRNIEFTE